MTKEEREKLIQEWYKRGVRDGKAEIQDALRALLGLRAIYLGDDRVLTDRD